MIIRSNAHHSYVHLIFILGGAGVCQKTGVLLPAEQRPLLAGLWSPPGTESIHNYRLFASEAVTAYSGVRSAHAHTQTHTDAHIICLNVNIIQRAFLATAVCREGGKLAWIRGVKMGKTLLFFTRTPFAHRRLCVCDCRVFLHVLLWQCEGCGLRVRVRGEQRASETGSTRTGAQEEWSLRQTLICERDKTEHDYLLLIGSGQCARCTRAPKRHRTF